MSTTRLLLVRHAEVAVDYQHVFGGRVDMDISPRGHEQAAVLAKYLHTKPFDALYASPMKRVQQTLAALQTNGCPPPKILADLREVDFGDWTGHSWEAIREKFGVSAFTWLDQLECGSIPNAECVAECRARVAGCLDEILATHPGKTIAIFCHGGVIRLVLSNLLQLPLPKTDAFQIEYASVTEVSIGPDRTRIELLNFVPWRDLRP